MRNFLVACFCCAHLLGEGISVFAADSVKVAPLPSIMNVEVFRGAYGGATIKITTDRPLDPTKLDALPVEIEEYSDLRYPGTVGYPQMLFFVEAGTRVDTGLYSYEGVGLVALEFDRITLKDRSVRTVFRIIGDPGRLMVWDVFLMRNELFVTLAPFAHVLGVTSISRKEIAR